MQIIQHKKRFQHPLNAPKRWPKIYQLKDFAKYVA